MEMGRGGHRALLIPLHDGGILGRRRRGHAVPRCVSRSVALHVVATEGGEDAYDVVHQK